MSIDQMSSKTGRIIKEDNTTVNVADILDSIYDSINNAIDITGSAFESSATLTRANTVTAYSIGDVIGTDVSGNLTFSNCSSANGNSIIITGVSLEVDTSSVPSGMGSFRLHLYNVAPASIADNVAFNLPSGDRTKYLGWIDIDTPTDLGDTLFVRMNNVNMQVKLSDSSTTLVGMLETRGAFTPIAQIVKKVTLYIVGV